jgi:hypothetical protein
MEEYVELIIKADSNDADYIHSFNIISLNDMKELYPYLMRIIELQKEDDNLRLDGIITKIAMEERPDNEYAQYGIYDYLVEFIPSADWVCVIH